jgi:hypothetical protein
VTGGGVSAMRRPFTSGFQDKGSLGVFSLTYNNVANLQTGALAVLEYDEQGRSLVNGSTVPYFWTGMNDDATTNVSIGTCTNWSSSSSEGVVGSLTDLQRSNPNIGSPTYCGNGNRLLCIEQSRTPRPAPLAATRKRVFVTSTSFTGALGGLSGADMRCELAAAAGNKGGTWKAFLATTSAPGVSRINDVGPWYQETALGVFSLTYKNVANLQTGALAVLEYDEQGRSLVNGSTVPYFWTGMNDDGTTNLGLGNCTNWASASSEGVVGSLTELQRSNPNIGSPTYCGNSNRLLCIEQ